MDDEPAPLQARMVVLQVLPRVDHGDVARAVIDVARHVAARGYRSIVGSAGGQGERELLSSGVLHERLTPGDQGPLAIWRNSRRLARLVHKHKVSIVHAHDPASAWAAGLACRKGDAALLATCHGLRASDEQGWRRRFTRVLTAGDRVVAVSDFVAERLVQTFAIEPSRVRTIYPGVDLDEFDPEGLRGHRIAATADRWDIGVDQPIVLVPGPIAPSNGHQLVLRAMARMERKDFLLVFGSRWDDVETYARQLAPEIQASGLGGRVRWVDEQHDLAALLKIADSVVLATGEALPFSRGIAAAQAMGKPVIVTSRGALPEMMMPGSTGWMIDPTSLDELAWAIDVSLSLDDDARDRLARRARDFAADTLNLERTCRRTLSLYRELTRVRTLARAEDVEQVEV